MVVRVGFMVGRVTVGRILSEHFGFTSPIIIPSVLPAPLSRTRTLVLFVVSYEDIQPRTHSYS
jgi:hypothetical protein